MAKALIRFEKYGNTNKPSELYLMAGLPCGRDLQGTVLFGEQTEPMSLDTAERYLHEAVEKLKRSEKYKYANPVNVVRDNQGVYIESEGIISRKKKRICGYVKLEDAD